MSTRRRTRLVVQSLEGRRLLAVAPQTYIVTNLNDSGAGSLRDAIAKANADTYSGSAYDTINFKSSLAGGTIELTTVGDTTLGPSALSIKAPIHIDGSTAPGLSIARSSTAKTPQFRIFYVSTSGDLNLRDVTITRGHDSSFDGGGGLYNDGTMTLTDDTFDDNHAYILGGGGFANGPSATAMVRNCTFTGNSALDGGGGVRNFGIAIWSAPQ